MELPRFRGRVKALLQVVQFSDDHPPVAHGELGSFDNGAFGALLPDTVTNRPHKIA